MTAMHLSYKGEPEREPLPYPDCGLDDVYLLGGYERVETRHGSGIVVKDLDDLHRAITYYLVTEKKVLNGKELRFLRKHLDLSQAELGRRLRLSDQQVARWEKDQCDISGPADTLLRLYCLQHLGAKIDPLGFVQELEERDARVDDKAVFAQTSRGWRQFKAA